MVPQNPLYKRLWLASQPQPHQRVPRAIGPWRGAGQRPAPIALRCRCALVLAAIAGSALLPLSGAAAERPGPHATPEQRGEYVFHLTGGCGCHTDYKNKGAFLAGGRAIKTPFGVIYGTNITPDRDTGLGTWSEEDFVRAMTQGVRKDGQDLYPVFPYTSFTRMTPADLKDLWAYLKTVPAVKQENRPADLSPPFGMRLAIGGWKALFFTPAPFQPDPAASAEVNRGAYIVQALAHCAECHTPRNAMGALKADMAFAGSTDGPEGQLAPNVTPEKVTGIGAWSVVDTVYFFQTGDTPDGDFAEGLMSEVIEHGYAKTSEDDLKAVAVYLKTLKPIVHKLEKKKK